VAKLTGEHPRVLVVVPTYNERGNLPGVVARLRSAVPEADLLIVDDASPDGTGEVADRLAAGGDAAVLHRPGKRGLGSAYVHGFAWGLERGYELLVEMDADGSHLPEELPRLLAAARHADVVLGSRWMPAGAVRHWSHGRRLLSLAANRYAPLLLGLPLVDATGGFRVFRRSVLERLPIADVCSEGYCFQVEAAWRAWQAGFRIAQVPITFVEREWGQSKMSRAILAEAAWQVSRWGAGRLAGRPLGAGG
jgi:glycosyltransferase involved in cell wall biosynthesis